MKAIIGKKVGMTQIFDENGFVIPVTVIEAGPCTVAQVKSVDTDGYNAVQLGFGDVKVGDEIKVDTFNVGDSVDIQGTTKGKGFQGVIKRHGQHRGPMGHGSMYHRRPGSMGSTSTPGRVFKGKKLPGHMGVNTVTIQNLKIVKVDTDKNVILVKGSVPGNKYSVLKIRKSVKASK